MALLGKRNLLPVSREADVGIYLDAGPLGEILLPRRYVTPAMVHGQQVDVFLYRDSEDRLVATTDRPRAMLGEFACMEVKDVSDRAGAFLDWGLPKDLLLPFREQGKPVRIGQKVVVAVCMDERTNRIIASARVDKHFGDGMPPYKAGEQVEALVFARTPLGFNAVVGNAYRGLLYFQHGGKDQRASGLSYGQRVKCFVTGVREDRKVDLSLDAAGYQRVAPLTEQVMAALTAAGGTLAVDDDTPPELIRASFGVSKKAFKQALGALFKAKRIEFTKPGIRSVRP